MSDEQVQVLDFSELIPTRHKFKDEDGTEYEFRSRRDFGATEYTGLKKTANVAQAAIDRIDAEAGDEDRAAQEVDDSYRKIIALILPDLPSERLQALSFGQMNAVFKFWEKADTPYENGTEGEADAD